MTGSPSPVTRGRLLSISIASAAIAVALAGAISWIRFRSLSPLAILPAPLPRQVLEGAAAGAILGSAAVVWFLRAAIFEAGRAAAREALASAPLTRADVTLMSFAAGIGEELLFRGAVQPLIGVGLTSVVFTAVHYWVPLRGVARACYAGFVFAVSVVLGFLCQRTGILAAMTAHTTVDLVVLWVARDRLRPA